MKTRTIELEPVDETILKESLIAFYELTEQAYHASNQQNLKIQMKVIKQIQKKFFDDGN